MTSSETKPLLSTTSSASTYTTAAPNTASSISSAPSTSSMFTTAESKTKAIVADTVYPTLKNTSPSPGGGGGGGGKKDGSMKKKQPPFLEREVKILNPDQVNQEDLLIKMHARFEEGYKRWKKRSSTFKLANLIVTLLIVGVQVSQVVIFQMHSIPTSTKTAIATILPAVTGAVLAVQLKLGWGEKAQKCKKSARLYNKLATHAEYRMAAVNAGAELSDSVKVWNTALISETTEVPAFLLAY